MSSRQRALCLNILPYIKKEIKRFLKLKRLISKFFQNFSVALSEIKESDITVRANIVLSLVPRAGANIAGVEHADRVLYS